MNETEQRASDTLPLGLAAARLGISPDALRMRINRGKIRGFKKGGRLFAVLDEAPNQAQRTAQLGTEQATPGRFEQARGRSASFRGPGDPSLPLVVEFQKVELSRLLRDNSRLNQRLDQLIEELRHLREMQQREQVLRQQDQALRQRAQALIERLTAPPAPAPPVSTEPAFARSMPPPPISDPPVSDPPVSDSPMAHLPGPEAAGPENAPAFPDAGSSESALGSESAAPGDVPGDHAAKAGGGGGPPDLHREDPAHVPAHACEEDAMPPASPPASPPGPPPGPSAQSGASWDGARRDAAELADMLKEIGTSLRGLDSAAADALATTAPDLPQPDLPQTAPEPPPVPAARRTPGDLAGAPSGAPSGPPSGPPSGAPADDEAGLLEILGRMGPSAEERRIAARLMKRLFKGRAARRRGEPGDDAD